MNDDFGTQGLSGTEIIDDFLAQLRKRLAGDCNLRPSDSYSRGYSAKINYTLTLYGMDSSVVDADFTIGTEKDDLDAEVVQDTMEVEQEEDLSSVRSRLENLDQDTEGFDEENTEISGPISVAPGKRKYTRKVKLATGGAEDFVE